MATTMSHQDVNPIQRAFNLFVMSLPSADLESLLQFVGPSDESRRSTFENDFIRNAAEVITTIAAHEQFPSSPASSDGSAPSVRGKKTGDRKLRPLNSFIAYRSFYSTLFPELTQKTKSGLIKDLWQADPYKGKWAILAKAYSIIRDDHGRRVSLDSFLELTVPFIGIIRPESYLAAMGFRVLTANGQQYTIENVSPSGLNVSEVTTNHSVADVVDFCYEQGYVPSNNAQNAQQTETTAQLAFAAQPNPNVRTDQNAIVLDNVLRVMPFRPAPITHIGNEDLNASVLLEAHQPFQTQLNLFRAVGLRLEDLRQYNEDDSEFYAPFNPTVHGMPTYDPLANDPFNAYDLSEMPI